MQMVIIGIELAVASYYDWKYLSIPKVYMKVIAVINVVLVICNQLLIEIGTYIGIGFGIFLLLVARSTREAIGYGDAYLFLLIGMVLGGKETLVLFLMTTLIIALYGMALCMFKGVSRKYVVPMVPFSCLAYIIYQLII